MNGEMLDSTLGGERVRSGTIVTRGAARTTVAAGERRSLIQHRFCRNS